MYVDRTRTYIGVVEDNQDPENLGRVKIRVFNVFEDMPVDDIPWASPWKDLNGNEFNVPEKGKVLTVIFESGNIYKPEFIYSEHYNINLEQKIKSLSGDTYKSMKSLIFDHKTQIYVNDDEGLKIDYKFNNINFTDSTIDANLKDNYQKINLGDSSADQQAVLGTNWMNWFDEFVDNLMGSQGGPYLGNQGAPVTINPAFVACLQKYKSLRDPKFLSKNVYLNNNGAISTVRQTTNSDKDLRPNNTQQGDKWKSTVIGNDLVSNDNSNFKPRYGNGDETPESTGSLSPSGSSQESGATVSPPVGEVNPDVDKIIKAMKAKGYVVETKTNFINIVGIRYQYEGQNYSNRFMDRMWAIWMNDSNQWESQNWSVSTIPGTRAPGKKQSMKSWCASNRPKGLGIMVPAQYKNIYQFKEAELPENQYKMKARPYFVTTGNQQAYRDTHFDDDIIHFDNKNSIDVGFHAMYIHRGFPGGSNVDNWSEGCQVFSRENDFKALCNLARNHIKVIGKNSFHYTLLMSSDVE